jgi:hypothetical protein
MGSVSRIFGGFPISHIAFTSPPTRQNEAERNGGGGSGCGGCATSLQSACQGVTYLGGSLGARTGGTGRDDPTNRTTLPMH